MQTEITKIQKTKQGHYALFCVSGFLFSVDELTVSEYHLQEGIVLSEAELSALEKKSQFQKAKSKALTYLSLRDYGRAELRAKLERLFDEDTAIAAVQKMQELGYIDDERFAAHRAKYLLETRGMSIRETGQKLRQLKLDREIIKVALEAFSSEEGDKENAVAFLRKKQLTNLQNGNYKKVLAAMQRKGFNYSAARYAVEVVLQEQNLQIDMDDEEF